jgi:hypothetical protein
MEEDKMRSGWVFTVVFLLLLSINAYGVQVSVPELSADPGSTIVVEISVDDATGVAGGDIVLEYAPAVLVVKEARMTDLAAGLSLIANTSVAGEVILSMAGINGLPGGSGAILEVAFEVKSDASGKSPLTLSDAALYDEIGGGMAVTVVNGSVTVKEPSVHPRMLTIADAGVGAGGLITTAIQIDDLTGVAGGDVTLLYNPVVLSVEEVRSTNLLAGMSVIVNTDMAGRIMVSLASTTGIEAGSGAILDISFKAKEDASGEADLIFESAELYDEKADAIPVQTMDGRITFRGTDVTATGELIRLAVTTFMYGTHGLLSDGDLSYALKSSTIDLNQFVGRQATVQGSLVHSGIDGGPPLIDVLDVSPKSVLPPAVREHAPGSPILALQSVYNEANVHGHTYIDIWKGSVPIEAGQFLEFQVAMFSGSPVFSGTVDLHTSDGSTLGDSGAKDQNDVSAHPSSDVSEYARDQWYHRKIPLDALAGKVLDGVMIATYSDEHEAGLFRLYVDNIQITDGEHILAAIYMDGDAIPITGTNTSTETTFAGAEGMSDYSVSIVSATPVTPRGKLISMWGFIKSGRQ